MAGEEVHERWLAGEFDLARSFRNVPPASVLESPQTILEERAGLATWYVAFNVDAPPFDDVRARKAFSHASDRARLHTEVQSLAEPAERGGVIPPPMPAHSHRAGLPYDPELARRLLAEAGHPSGQGLPELTVYARTATSGEALARQWRETLGARTRVFEMEEGTPTSLDAHAVTDGWLADYPSPGNFFRGLRAGSPIPLYTDEREQGLLDEAQSLRDRRAKIRAYHEVERLWITEQAALVPLEYMRHAALRRPWLEGYWLGYLGASLDQVTIRRPLPEAV
jgi:ABC-type transport system substrate-binding protein